MELKIKRRACLAAFMAVIMAMILPLQACNVGQFEAVLNEVAPAVLDVLQIVALFSGKTVDTSVTTKISADVAALEKLYSDFQTAKDAGAKQSIQADIQAAFATLNADLSSVFAVAQVSDKATQAKIAALIGLIETAVNIAEAVIPSAAPTVTNTPKLSASEFAASYNKILTAKTGNAKVDDYISKHVRSIHNHGSFVRHMSLEIAK